MNSSNYVARVVVLKHTLTNNKNDDEKNTKKIEFNASLHPKSETSIHSHPGTTLVDNFGISEKIAPMQIFKQSVHQHRIVQLHKSYPIAMVRFRIGEQEGVAYVDIINMNLQTSQFSWSDDLLAIISNKIANGTKSIGVAGVGGFNRLESGLRQNHDWEHQSRLYKAIETELGNILPLREEPYF